MAKLSKKNNNMKKLVAIITIMPTNKNAVILDLIEKYGVNYHLSFLGEGSASNEILAMLGLRESKRIVTISFIREDRAKDCLDAIEDKINQLALHAIAFCVNLDSIIGLKNYLFLADLGGKAWKKN